MTIHMREKNVLDSVIRKKSIIFEEKITIQDKPLRGCWNLYYRPMYFRIFVFFFSFFIQNENSFSKIKEKMQINVDKYKSVQNIYKKFFNYNFLLPDLT